MTQFQIIEDLALLISEILKHTFILHKAQSCIRNGCFIKPFANDYITSLALEVQSH